MEKESQTFFEYIIIIFIITIISLILSKFAGGYLKDTITRTSCSLVNQKYIKSNKIGEGYCEGANKHGKEQKY